MRWGHFRIIWQLSELTIGWNPFSLSELRPYTCESLPRPLAARLAIAQPKNAESKSSVHCIGVGICSWCYLMLHVCVRSHFSRVWLFAIPWTVARQAPLSMGFSRQEYCGGLPCPPPGDLPDPGIEPASPASPALQVNFYHWATSSKTLCMQAVPDMCALIWRENYLEQME